MTIKSFFNNLGVSWRAFMYVLNICRFSIIILIAAIVLLSVGQGQDLLLSVGEDHRYGLLLGSTLLWASSIWLWARTLLDIHFPVADQVEKRLLGKYRKWFPRSLGALAFVGVAYAVNTAGEPVSKYTWLTLLTGFAFLVFVSNRRRVGQRLATMLAKEHPEQHFFWVEHIKGEGPQYPDWKAAAGDTLGKIALAMLVAGLLLFIWGLVSPISMGAVFNALVLLMVWGASFLPIGSAISYAGNKTGAPLLSMLLALAVLFSLWNDNHAIRPLYSQTPIGSRPTVAETVHAWQLKHCRAKACDPFILVATAGGGIRAGYWTGAVLGYLHDTNLNNQNRKHDFEEQLFAISGVSGGSVGATVYRGIATAADEAECKHKVLKCTLDVLSRDYLSPLSASLLYPDLLQRFLPRPWLPDRARTLEKSWEQGFKDVTGKDTLSQSLSGLGTTGQAWPVLFLNATWSNNGRRIVASNLRYGDDKAFELSNDQLNRIGYDLRLSTAAHNSARFPYISPAGSWRKGEGDDKTSGEIIGRLQDGGLFENYGAETALEVLRYAKSVMGDKFNPMVILISSDPSLPEDLATSETGEVKNLAYEIMTTIRSVFATRVGRGAELASQLKDWSGERFAYFRMCGQPDDEIEPPLGWSLSRQAQMTIQAYLLETSVDGKPLATASCRQANLESARKVLSILD